MIRVNEIAEEVTLMNTLVELTSVFEGIASMRITQIKSQVQQSSQFFSELWDIYSHLNVRAQASFGEDKSVKKIKDRELYIIVTSEGGFSGDIDQKLVQLMLSHFDREKHDIIVIGHHGATQLAQLAIPYKRYFKLPASDFNINVTPLIKEIQHYHETTLFYQQYVSLMYQEVKSISLTKAIEERSQDSQSPSEGINEETYIFEPSTEAVAAHLEQTMMIITLSQLIFDSKLAQYASRFRAMTASHHRADESRSELRLTYNRARRAIKDERLKEIVNGLKKARQGTSV